jgi:microcystin-dependent protein
MATVTGFTAERMSEIEGASIISGAIVGNDLILIKHNGEQIDAGYVVGPQGPQGETGPPGFSFIPGQLLIWPNNVLPVEATYGKWVWADGAAYLEEDYPIASGNINVAWKTFAGAANPGAGYFRVPDLRGLVPAGLDQMPGGSRANRMTRSLAITIAAKTGEETHVITINEMPSHRHDGVLQIDSSNAKGGSGSVNIGQAGSTQYTGGGAAHENVQPTVFIPYIVKLDD